jgi:transposase-like protein
MSKRQAAGPVNIFGLEYDPRQRVNRWTALQKASLVDAIDRGRIKADEAMRVHGISSAELLFWRARMSGGGIAGLREKSILKIQQLRSAK